jgi:hypothetical protein
VYDSEVQKQAKPDDEMVLSAQLEAVKTQELVGRRCVHSDVCVVCLM